MSETANLLRSAEEVLRERAESLAQESSDGEVGATVQLLLFRIDEEWYSVRVESVREIYQECHATPIPGVPGFILGVMNIRGEILSVTDIAALMNLGGSGSGVRPAIIVHQGRRATAMVVDEVGDIIEPSESSLEAPVSTIDRAQAEFVAESVYVDERLVGVVNVDRVLEPIGGSTRH